MTDLTPSTINIAQAMFQLSASEKECPELHENEQDARLMLASSLMALRDAIAAGENSPSMDVEILRVSNLYTKALSELLFQHTS